MDESERWAMIGVDLRRLHARLEALLQDEDLAGELHDQVGKVTAAADLTLVYWHQAEAMWIQRARP